MSASTIRKAKKLVENSSLTDIEKADVINTIEDGQKKLEEKEQQLKSAANQPAREMSQGDISKILEDIKSDISFLNTLTAM